MNHDPLCLLHPSGLPVADDDGMCSCGLIARVRADERERIAVWPNTRAFIEDDLRAQIAADIEAALIPNALNAGFGAAYLNDGLNLAARIARGESDG